MSIPKCESVFFRTARAIKVERPALLFANAGLAQLRDLSDWFMDAFGASVGIGAPSKGMVRWFINHHAEFSIVLVDARSFNSLEDVIELCLTIRETAPRLPIVLMDTEFSRDESCPERSVICDYSLRLPVSEARFIEAVSEAFSERQRILDRRSVKQSASKR